MCTDCYPQVIRLEFGALAAWNPIIITEIESYASTMYPAVFERKATSIVTVTPERTFGKKPQFFTMKLTDLLISITESLFTTLL
jgi:type VI protein secretion system component Hcp